MTVDPLVLVAEVERATGRLTTTVRGLDAAALLAPSLLPGWTRGHVLAHVARNADSGVNLLTWARTGVRTPQYTSAESREADIEAGADRPLDVHLTDLAASAERFADAVARMPAAAWTSTVTWRSGRSGPAARIMWSRLREVEVHHVDLDHGYAPADWPEAFTRRLLNELVAGWADNPQAPRIRLHATDLDADPRAGTASSTVSGPGAALTAWLIGRSAGESLTMTPDGPLPPVPTWI